MVRQSGFAGRSEISILYGDIKKAEPIGFRIKIPAGGLSHPIRTPWMKG